MDCGWKSDWVAGVSLIMTLQVSHQGQIDGTIYVPAETYMKSRYVVNS
jgi:hypothetical protein